MMILALTAKDIKEGQWLKKGMEVTFQVYTDDKGAAVQMTTNKTDIRKGG